MLNKTDVAIQKLLNDNIIQDSNSDFINESCLVQKTDGIVRVTIDARRLNSMTTQNLYRSEPVQSQINKVNGARWVTLLDLNQAFLQVLLHEHCRNSLYLSTAESSTDLPELLSVWRRAGPRSPEPWIKCSGKGLTTVIPCMLMFVFSREIWTNTSKM